MIEPIVGPIAGPTNGPIVDLSARPGPLSKVPMSLVCKMAGLRHMILAEIGNCTYKPCRTSGTVLDCIVVGSNRVDDIIICIPMSKPQLFSPSQHHAW